MIFKRIILLLSGTLLHKAYSYSGQYGREEVRDGLIGQNGDAVDVVQQSVGWILGFLALIVFTYFLYGGFTILTAAGNDDQVKKGRGIIVRSALGVVVIFLAWVIVALVFSAVNST